MITEEPMRSLRDVPKICVCSPHFASQAYYQRLRGIYNYLNSLVIRVDIQIRIITSQEQLDTFLNQLPELGLDGVIFISLSLTDENVMKVRAAGSECVLIENYSTLCPCITNENFEGGRLAARYFLDHGYQSFGFLCEPFHWAYSVYTIQDRLMGFQAELGASGYIIPKEHIYESKIDRALVRERFVETFRKGDYPKAFFVPADVMAIGFIQAAHDCGLKIPENVAVIGFDDVDAADIMGLTTISQHLDESGEIAAKMLLDKIHNPHNPDKQIDLKLTLVERKTA